MKLRKSKLAALLLSVMAVGAMSSFAYAEEAEVPSTVDNEVAYTIIIDNTYDTDDASYAPVFNYDEDTDTYSVTYYVYDTTAGEVVTKAKTATASVDESKSQAVTCVDDGYDYVYAYLEDVSTAYVYTQYPTGVKTGHTADETYNKIVVTKAATCYEDGESYHQYLCTVCRDYYYDGDVIVVPATGNHSWDDGVYVTNGNIKVDDDGNVVFDSNGNATLLDSTKDGWYYILYSCETDGCEATYTTTTTMVYAQTSTYIQIIDADDEIAYFYIDTDEDGVKEQYTLETLIAADIKFDKESDLPDSLTEIELAKCTEGGTYTICYYNSCCGPLGMT